MLATPPSHQLPSVCYFLCEIFPVPLYSLSCFLSCPWASPIAQSVKNLPSVQETRVRSLIRKIPWRRKRQPTPVSLPGEFHGQKSLAGCSPWGRKELGRLSDFHFTFTCPNFEQSSYYAYTPPLSPNRAGNCAKCRTKSKDKYL